jgi:hypothetical protein
MTITSVLWRRVDRPGHESARIVRVEESAAPGWRLEGSAVFGGDAGEPCALAYEVLCDDAWQTRSGRVTGWAGASPVAIEIEARNGAWRMNGRDVPEVEGAVDIDLNFSPSTNLLPVRRLALAVGEEATVVAAWLRFPGFTLERLEQTYRRTGEWTWRYQSAGGRFVRDLDVDAAGFVIRYPDFWMRA